MKWQDDPAKLSLFLQDICKRAGKLSLLSMAELRLAHPDNLDGTRSGAQWKGITKAQLIEEILWDIVSDEVFSDADI